MHFTPAFKSSPHCSASPDGSLVATLLPSKIVIRSVESLETVNTITLPSDASGPVYAFHWSPSSSRILVALIDHVHIFSVFDNTYHATIRIAHAGLKPTFVQFGSSDSEVFICSQFGLKLTIANLTTSTSVEINQPKFHHPSSAPRGVALHPATGHLALITRVSGKDTISLHDPVTRQVQRSWTPDTEDAQSLTWTPNGRWLVVTESASQGHKLLFYTADGQLYKAWAGPSGFATDTKDYEMGAGIKVCDLSSDSTRVAVGDHTRDVYVLDITAVTDLSRLQHPTSLVPRDTLQIWQEQSGGLPEDTGPHSFVKATQTLTPPSRNPQINSNTESKEGCLGATFDKSASLLATRLEDSPSTVWIWDLVSSELRAVLIFHNTVSYAAWHPSIRELLLVRCEGEGYDGIAFVWDPLSDGPTTVNFSKALPEPRVAGKTQCCWMNRDGETGTLLFSDNKHMVMAAFTEAEQPAPWQSYSALGRRSASSKLHTPSILGASREVPLITPEDLSAADDTFAFRNT